VASHCWAEGRSRCDSEVNRRAVVGVPLAERWQWTPIQAAGKADFSADRSPLDYEIHRFIGLGVQTVEYGEARSIDGRFDVGRRPVALPFVAR